jgi:hypothetical protein
MIIKRQAMRPETFQIAGIKGRDGEFYLLTVFLSCFSLM